MLQVDEAMLQRSVNEGFSGGEKKRNEIFHMAVLEPRLAILDETDSGLDIDALKIVSQGVNAMRAADRAFIVVTHYQRLLNYIVPDFVHVLSDGLLVRSGGRELALELEEKGYGWLETACGEEREHVSSCRASRRRAGEHGPIRAGSWRVRAGVAARAAAERGASRFAAARLPDGAAGRVALHQRRADRGDAVPAGGQGADQRGRARRARRDSADRRAYRHSQRSLCAGAVESSMAPRLVSSPAAWRARSRTTGPSALTWPLRPRDRIAVRRAEHRVSRGRRVHRHSGERHASPIRFTSS